MPLVKDMKLTLPTHFPKSLMNASLEDAIQSITDRIGNLTNPDSIRKSKACLNALTEAAGSSKSAGENEKKKATKKSRSTHSNVGDAAAHTAAKSVKAKKAKAEETKEEEPSEKPVQKKKSRKSESSIRQKIFVHSPGTMKRKSKENGLPNIICAFFDIPAKPDDVIDDIIKQYTEIEPSPSQTYLKDPSTYVHWYIVHLVKNGRLIESD